jgi:SAM-dependent methyltransferase
MTHDDLNYIAKLLKGGDYIQSPVLELGAGYGGDTSEHLIKSAGLDYSTTDIHTGPNVDYIANFESSDCSQAFEGREFGSVLVLNVLEHVFEPIRVLDNAFACVRSGGTVVAITPSMWPIHNYPIDCQRLLPDWYREYAKRKSVILRPEVFEYVGVGPVESIGSGDQLQLPPPWDSELSKIYSKAIHKVFNTVGRTHWTKSHSAIGVVFTKP